MYQRVCRDEQMAICDDTGVRFPAVGTCMVDFPSMDLTFDAKLVVSSMGPNTNGTTPNTESDTVRTGFGLRETLLSAAGGLVVFVIIIVCTILYCRKAKAPVPKTIKDTMATEDQDLMIMYLDSIEESKRHHY